MTKNKMIQILIEDQLDYFYYARNTEALADLFYWGWTGYDNYSYKELEKEISDLDKNCIKKYLKRSKNRLASEQKYNHEVLVSFDE